MRYSQAEYGYWPPYVPVAERRRQVAQEVATLRKRGKSVSPVILDGRNIATTFWGRAWCVNLESYSDYKSRLERGRSYLRNGSVVDLQIAAGEVTALVMGSELYQIEIAIKPLAAAQWQALIRECSGKIDSLIELLQGKLSQGVMEVLTRRNKGLFPEPRQIQFSCSCPDSARLCKHVAAVLYGVGARLDEEPELLFRLRHVAQADLIAGAGAGRRLDKTRAATSAKSKELAGQDLSALFGIDLDSGEAARPPKEKVAAAPAASANKSAAAKLAAPAKISARTLMTRKELLARGASAATLQTWLRTGLLIPAGERGTYKTTVQVRKKLAELSRT